MKKKLFSALCMVATAILLTGCSSAQPDKSNDDTKQEVMTEHESSTYTVTDVKGEVEIPANPERIVDLSGNSDILSILGYSVVGTANSDAYDYTKFPTYLEDTLKDATILGYSMQETMDIESIIACNPDLIIISTTQEKMYDQLQKIAPTVMVQLEALDMFEDIRTFAGIFGKEEAAETFISTYQAKEIGEEVREKYGEDTTYLAFLASGGSFFLFDGAGFGSVIYTDMGLKKPSNMPEQEDISLPVVNYEGLASLDPDVIFCIATDADLQELQSNQIWNNMRAVKAGNVIILPSSPYFNIGYSCIGRDRLVDEIPSLLNTVTTNEN